MMELTRDQARMQWDIFHEMSEHEQVVFFATIRKVD